MGELWFGRWEEGLFLLPCREGAIIKETVIIGERGVLWECLSGRVVVTTNN